MSKIVKPHNKSPHKNNLAIIAGNGELPNLVYLEMNKLGTRPWVFYPDNIKVDNPKETNRVLFSPLDLEGLFLKLRELNINEVVFVGRITRDTVMHTQSKKLDNLFYNDIYPILEQTDDQILRRVGKLFESHGFSIKGVTELLPEALSSKGNLTRLAPSLKDKNDIMKAIEYHEIFSKSDVGQSLIVSNGLCLAVETLPGTDAMLDFAKEIKSKNFQHDIESGIFYKAPKIGQDIRFDVPVIGETTIAKVKDAKLKGIALKENAVILLNKDKIIQFADELCLFIVMV